MSEMSDEEAKAWSGCLGVVGIAIAGCLIGGALGSWQLGLGIPVLAVSVLFLIAALQKEKQ